MLSKKGSKRADCHVVLPNFGKLLMTSGTDYMKNGNQEASFKIS